MSDTSAEKASLPKAVSDSASYCKACKHTAFVHNDAGCRAMWGGFKCGCTQSAIYDEWFAQFGYDAKRDAEQASPVVTDAMCQAALRMVVLKTRVISGQPQLPDIAAIRAALEAALSVKGGEAESK